MKRFDIKKRILKKSVDLFYKHGFVKASVRDIVKAVGINNATLYLYFKNKDEVLFQIIMDVGADLLNELQKTMGRHKDPVICLGAMIERQVRFSFNEYKKMKLYLEELYQLRPHLIKRALKQHRQIYHLYYEKIRELDEKGLLYQADPSVITFYLFGAINWINKWYQPDGRLSMEEIISDISTLFFRSILTNQRDMENPLVEFEESGEKFS